MYFLSTIEVFFSLLYNIKIIYLKIYYFKSSLVQGANKSRIHMKIAPPIPQVSDFNLLMTAMVLL